MARELLTVGGQIIGYSIGGPIGAFIGGYIGMQVGYAIDPLDPQYGPKLEDRRVQTSAYGQQVPLLYGVTRVSGNVIWSEDLEEVESSENVGGKGGPSQEVITYDYFGTFAVLIGRGELRGIRRIWADTVLVYDGTYNIDNPGADVADFTFYTGSETQEPDPIMEAALGVGSTPAYRGYSYVVFERMPLDRFGNRLPSLSFEVNGVGDWRDDLPVTYLGTGHTLRWRFIRQLNDGRLFLAKVVGDTMQMAIADPLTGAIQMTGEYAPGYGKNNFYTEDIIYVPPTNQIWLMAAWYDGTVYPATFGPYIVRIDADTLTQVGTPIDADNGQFGLPHKYGYYDSYANAVNTVAGTAFTQNQFQQFDLEGNLVNEPVDGYDGNPDNLVGGGEFCCIATGYYWFAALQNKGSEVTVIVDGNPVTTFAGQGTVLASQDVPSDINQVAIWDPKRKRYVIFGESNSIYTVADSSTPTIVYEGMLDTTYDVIQVTSYMGLYHGDLDAYIILDNNTITAIDAETFAIKIFMGIPYTVSTSEHEMRLSTVNPNSVVICGREDTATGRLYELRLFATTVAQAVASMCDESGYTAADYDVSELTDELRGFRVMRLGPLRQSIEQLATVFHFEGCEQDDKLVFKKRGRASSAAYALSDLVIDGPNELPLKSARAQESSLPKRLTLTAPDPYTDHQPGAQQAERWTVVAGQDEQFAVDVVLSANEAKQVADAVLFDRWVSRITASFKLGSSALRLTYGDVVTIDSKRYRIIGRNLDLFTLSFDVVADDPDVVTQTSSGAQGDFPGQEVSKTISSGLIIVDSALLRTADEGAGAYGAVYPLGTPSSWRGAVIYSSVDSGANWSNEAVTPSPGVTYGLATNALGDFTGGAVFDEYNTLTIQMTNGAPSSTTRATLLNSDTNAAAVKSGTTWEIIQFRTATNNGGGSYTLSGLLRGRRGTEHAIAGHAIGDQFVLLDTATLRDISITNGQIGVSQRFKAVSVRQSIDDAAYQVTAINAVRLKPWAPTDLRAARNTSNSDIVYTWKRRSRWQSRFTGGAGMNVPQSETSESYVVEVVTAGSPDVVRSTTVGSPTWTYTTAMQTADGHTLGAPAMIRVYQVSSVVGRGYALEETK